MNEFKSYNSIDNLTNGYIEKIKLNSKYHPDDWWIVTPKIDGSNVGIIFGSTSNDYKISSRKRYLDETERFHGIRDIVKELEGKFIEFRNRITKHFENVSSITFFGEICGGYYEGIESKVKPIFKRVQYSNKMEFVLFDVRVIFDDESVYYLSYGDVQLFSQEFGIPHVPMLYIGTLDECLEYSEKHYADLDPMWKIFGMPHEIKDNIREGHVIQPEDSWFIGESRVIIKHKNAKFDEKKDREKKKSRPKKIYSKEVNELISEGLARVNENRFYSVVSKIGEYDMKDFGRIMNDIVDDVFEEFEREEGKLLEAVKEQGELDSVRKAIVKFTSTFMGRNKKELF